VLLLSRVHCGCAAKSTFGGHSRVRETVVVQIRHRRVAVFVYPVGADPQIGLAVIARNNQFLAGTVIDLQQRVARHYRPRQPVDPDL
jgi:hypothetical protein